LSVLNETTTESVSSDD